MASDGKVVIRIDSNAEQVAVEFNQLDKSINKTERDAKKLDGQTRKTSKAFGGLKTALTSVAVAFAAVKIKEFTTNLVNAASEAEETANKFNVTFSGIAEQANETSREIAQAYGLANDETQKLLSNTGDLLTGFGFTQQAALDLAEQTNKLAVDLASFTNLEGGATRASEALTKALLGERESVKSLGIAILEEDVKAKVKALEISGQLTTQSEREKKAIATLTIAYEQSKNAIGDFARSQGQYANQNRILQATIRDLKVALGDELLPQFQELTKTIVRFLKDNDKFFKESASALITYVNNWVAGMDRIIEAVSTFNRFIRRVSISSETDIASLVGLDNDDVIFKLEKVNEQISEFESRLKGVKEGSIYFKQITESIKEQEKIQQVLKRELELREQIAKVQKSLTPQGDKPTPLSGGVDEKSSYAQLTERLKKQKELVQETASAQGIGSEALDSQIKKYRELKKQVADINGLLADDEVKNKWEDIGNSIENSLTSAFVASFERGENLLTNLGNAFKALFTQLAAKALALGLINLLTGGAGGFIGGAISGITANAKGNVIAGGEVQAFAKGGVVNSPTTFPMANGTGLMGEAGAEAILPLKRTSTGDLGVQAQPSNVNIYNQTDARIETVQRPDNETDVFIRRVNSALANERTNNSFASALNRQQSSGVQAS